MTRTGRHTRARLVHIWLVRIYLAAAIIGVAAWQTPASAELRVDITRGHVAPMPIAIPYFAGATAEEQLRGKEVASVIEADLERSGLFRPIDRVAFIAEQKKGFFEVQPRFADWRLINAQALVTGLVGVEQDGRLRVDVRLWDVFAGRQMIGRTYFAAPANWRRIAHLVADAIYKQMTGEDGYFDTRIVYIAESGPPERRVRRLAIMDQDGENHRYLTDGDNLVLTPRFSPTAQEITYLSYVRGKPRVYLHNIDSGRQEVLGDFPGMTFAPRFSPDGNKVVMSMAVDGNSEIYSMDLRTRQVQRLTNHPAIDTSPSVSPDGRHLVFNSDRGGSQQLYVMDSDGGNVKRISFGQGRYATPVWSPRGDLVAFTKIEGGTFSVGIMRPDGGGERILVNGFLVEGPTWAPNGRVLMYFRQTPGDRDGRGRTSRLYSVDLTGYNERAVAQPMDGSDPAWSPAKSP